MKLAKFNGQYGLVRLKQLAVLAAAVMFTAVGGAMAEQVGKVADVVQTSPAYVNNQKDTVTFTATIKVIAFGEKDSVTGKKFKAEFSGVANVVVIDSVTFAGTGTTRTGTFSVEVGSEVTTGSLGNLLFRGGSNTISGASDGGSNAAYLTVSPKRNISSRLILASKEVDYTPGVRQSIDKPTIVGYTSSTPYKIWYNFTPRAGQVSASAKDTSIYDSTGTAKLDGLGVLNAGLYNVEVKVSSKSDTACDTTTLRIRQRDLTSAMVNLTLPPSPGYVYGKKYRLPVITFINAGTGAKDSVVWDSTSSASSTSASSGLRKEEHIGLTVADSNNINAGQNTATVTVKGIEIGPGVNNAGNYRGSVTKTYSIAQKVITIDEGGSTVSDSPYDGTKVISPGRVVVEFVGIESVEGPANTANGSANGGWYKINSALLNSANVPVSPTVTATVVVALDTTAKNYKFGSATATFTKTGTFITKRGLAKDDFKWNDSTKHYFTNTARGVGSITINTDKLKEKQPDGAKVVTLYHKDGKDTTEIPVTAGSYPVKAQVTGNGNFDGEKIELGTYTIYPQLSAIIDSDLTGPSTVRNGKSVTLRIAAHSPQLPDNAGAVRYQWYRDTVKVGTNSPTFTYAATQTRDSVGSSSDFSVEVINAPGTTIQVPDTVRSQAIKITVDAPTVSLVNAKVTVNTSDTLYYNGEEQTPNGIAVKLIDSKKDTLELTNEQHYTYVLGNNVKAGTGTIRVTGSIDGGYEGTASGTFKIEKRPFSQDEIEYTESVEYTGSALPLQVQLKGGVMTGLGDATVNYSVKASGVDADTVDGLWKTTVPVDAGVYKVRAKFAAGANIGASDTGFIELGDYTVAKRLPTIADLNYTPWAKEILVAEAPAAGIGPVTVKAGTGYGKLTVLYDGDPTVPTTEGEYYVWVDVEGGANFESNVIELGVYKLVNVVAVAETAREIPTQVVISEAAVAPVKAVVAAFTAGPSPVKSGSSIKFFSAKPVKSGSLYIFDASGNAVAKLSNVSGVNEIASWNLKDKKGASVAEGSYIVKGALTGKDGAREKVSFVFSVVK